MLIVMERRVNTLEVKVGKLKKKIMYPNTIISPYIENCTNVYFCRKDNNKSISTNFYCNGEETIGVSMMSHEGSFSKTFSEWE